ncbi:MAG: hypothetical protein AAFR63_10890 [Cyanobacteria bacterium J06631_6]
MTTNSLVQTAIASDILVWAIAKLIIKPTSILFPKGQGASPEN